MNYSKNIVSYEQRLNMLISNLLKHILNIYQKYKEEKVLISELTETEKTIFTKLHNLSESELESFEKFISIIDLGLLKYLNKYFIIDVSFDHGVNIDFRTLSDPYLFRKITKKLNKEDKDNFIIKDIKKVFNLNYELLSSLLKHIIEINNTHISSTSIETIKIFLEKDIMTIEANILHKFTTDFIKPEVAINE